MFNCEPHYHCVSPALDQQKAATAMCPALGSEWWQPACLSLLQGEEIQVSFPVLPRGILSFLSHLPQECLITRARDKCIISHLKTESHEQGAGIERKEGSHALPTGAHQSSNAGEMQSCGITREKPSSFCRWRHLWCWASFPWWCQELCPRAGYGQPSGMLSRGNPVGSEESLCKPDLWGAWGWVGRDRAF